MLTFMRHIFDLLGSRYQQLSLLFQDDAYTLSINREVLKARIPAKKCENKKAYTSDTGFSSLTCFHIR